MLCLCHWLGFAFWEEPDSLISTLFCKWLVDYVEDSYFSQCIHLFLFYCFSFFISIPQRSIVSSILFLTCHELLLLYVSALFSFLPLAGSSTVFHHSYSYSFSMEWLIAMELGTPGCYVCVILQIEYAFLLEYELFDWIDWYGSTCLRSWNDVVRSTSYAPVPNDSKRPEYEFTD